ncbi:MAG: YdcF family protein [Lautropia sp.]
MPEIAIPGWFLDPAIQGKTLAVPWLLPPALLFVLVLLGVLLQWRWRRLGTVLLVLSALAGLAAALPVVATQLAGWLEAPYLGLDPPPQRLPTERLARWRTRAAEAPQVIVLLSGGSATDGADSSRVNRLDSESVERVLQARRLARLTGLPILITGGVVVGGDVAEAQMMRDLLVNDFEQPVRWVETRARDTEEHARFSRDILLPHGLRRVLLVTHAYHMRRAQWLFERAGFTVIPAPFGFLSAPLRFDAWSLTPRENALTTTRKVLREALGLAWYHAQSRWQSSTRPR